MKFQNPNLIFLTEARTDAGTDRQDKEICPSTSIYPFYGKLGLHLCILIRSSFKTAALLAWSLRSSLKV